MKSLVIMSLVTVLAMAACGPDKESQREPLRQAGDGNVKPADQQPSDQPTEQPSTHPCVEQALGAAPSDPFENCHAIEPNIPAAKPFSWSGLANQAVSGWIVESLKPQE